MNSIFKKRLIKIIGLVIVFSVPGLAHATIWVIDAVLTGSGVPGYGASSFHRATDSTPMSGADLGTITGAGILGTYNDVTGEFQASFDLSGSGGPTVSLTDAGAIGLTFTGGVLDPLGSLSVSFAGSDLTDHNSIDASNILYFEDDIVCCNGANNGPNSFLSDGQGGMIMTLWGANGWDIVNGGFNSNNSQYRTNLGIDLRLHLTVLDVAEPDSLILMGIGLLGLGFRRLMRHKINTCLVWISCLLTATMPDHTIFCKAGERISSKSLPDLSSIIRNRLKSQGISVWGIPLVGMQPN